MPLIILPNILFETLFMDLFHSKNRLVCISLPRSHSCRYLF
eukprot:UN24389